MNAALVKPVSAPRDLTGRRASRRVQLRRAIRLAGNIGRQWLESATFLPHLQGAAWDSAIRRLCGGTLRALDIKVIAAGAMPPGREPLLIVANHISWLDSYVIHSIGGCRFVAKAESSTWPVFRTILKGGKSITILRGSARGAKRAKDAVQAALSNGDRVGLFAEGTTSNGASLGDFHPALFQAAVETGATIQPIAIFYGTPDGVMATSPAYYGDITFAQSAAAVIRESAIIARVEFCAPISPLNATRQQLAGEARSRIAQKLKLIAADTAAGASAPLQAARATR